MIRETQKFERPQNVVITGICGRLGRLVAARLHETHQLIGIDRRSGEGLPPETTFYQLDLRRKKVHDVFREHKVDAVIHLGIMHDPRAPAQDHHSWNVVAFQRLVETFAKQKVKKLVLLSSANVYGPNPENDQFLTEDAPLLGSQHFSEVRDLIEVDMLTQSFFWRYPDLDTVILRPCHILGRVRNAASNFLRLKRPVTLMGFDPMIQVMHESDVVEAIRLSLHVGTRGIFNLAGPEVAPLSHILRLLKREPVTLPSFMARGLIRQMWRLRLASFPAPELDYLRYVCMVDDSRAKRVLGYKPEFSLSDTLRALDASSPSSPRPEVRR